MRSKRTHLWKVLHNFATENIHVHTFQKQNSSLYLVKPFSADLSFYQVCLHSNCFKISWNCHFSQSNCMIRPQSRRNWLPDTRSIHSTFYHSSLGLIIPPTPHLLMNLTHFRSRHTSLVFTFHLMRFVHDVRRR